MLGPWESFDACVTDPGLAEKYPDEEVRRRVCGALKARLELRGEVSRVEEGEDFWVIRNVVATRAGVNDQGMLRDQAAVEATARAMDGAPLVYAAHPHQVFVDPRKAAGFAVASRVVGDAAVYDALLWKRNRPGHQASDDDLAHNQAFVDAVRSGQAVHNSLGSISIERLRTGVAPKQGGGGNRVYDAVQEDAKVGHIAILSPVAGTAGGSCPAPVCGAVPDLEAAVRMLVGQGLSRGAALRLLAQ